MGEGKVELWASPGALASSFVLVSVREAAKPLREGRRERELQLRACPPYALSLAVVEGPVVVRLYEVAVLHRDSMLHEVPVNVVDRGVNLLGRVLENRAGVATPDRMRCGGESRIAESLARGVPEQLDHPLLLQHVLADHEVCMSPHHGAGVTGESSLGDDCAQCFANQLSVLLVKPRDRVDQARLHVSMKCLKLLL